jgi:transposase
MLSIQVWWTSMRANQKPRRRHGEQFKAQVLAACAEPGASVSPVALSFDLNANLVHQWRRGRGYKEHRPATPEAASESSPQFVPLALPAPSSATPPAVVAAPAAAGAILQFAGGAAPACWCRRHRMSRDCDVSRKR